MIQLILARNDVYDAWEQVGGGEGGGNWFGFFIVVLAIPALIWSLKLWGFVSRWRRNRQLCVSCRELPREISDMCADCRASLIAGLKARSKMLGREIEEMKAAESEVICCECGKCYNPETTPNSSRQFCGRCYLSLKVEH